MKLKKDENGKHYLSGSSLSRVWRHNENHDCGALTAFRKTTGCGDSDDDVVYTKEDNMKRNKQLKAELANLGYGVTALKGKYPEGGVVGKEISFWVVDLKDTGKLEKDLMRLGSKFEQDSVLYVPKGSIQGKDKGYLIGTGKCKNAFPAYGKKNVFDTAKMGYESKIYTSYINGRPFIFESAENGRIQQNYGNGFGYWQMMIMTEKIMKQDWKTITLDEHDYETLGDTEK